MSDTQISTETKSFTSTKVLEDGTEEFVTTRVTIITEEINIPEQSVTSNNAIIDTNEQPNTNNNQSTPEIVESTEIVTVDKVTISKMEDEKQDNNNNSVIGAMMEDNYNEKQEENDQIKDEINDPPQVNKIVVTIEDDNDKKLEENDQIESGISDSAAPVEPRTINNNDYNDLSHINTGNNTNEENDNLESKMITITTKKEEEKNSDTETDQHSIGQKVTINEKIKFILMFIGLAFGIFLAALDQTIVVTTLPQIAREFSKIDQISWIGTAYLLTSTAFQLTYGKFSDIFGRKSTFLTAVVIFTIGSIVCGSAPSMDILIVGRAIAGLGGGGIIGLVLIIITDIVPVDQRGKYHGIIGGCFAISSAVGPILGGIFVDKVTWRWAFYINAPLSSITLITVALFLHLPNNNGNKESLREKSKRIDWWGTLVIVGSIFFTLLALNWGGARYDWNHPIIIVLLCIGGIGFLSFFYIEGYIATEPLAPGRLFKNRAIVASFAVTFFQGMSFFTLVYVVPLFFQTVKETSATLSGVELLPYILATVFVTVFSGLLISRSKIITCYQLCIVGSILITISSGLISTFSETSSRGELTGYLIIAGFGAGLIMQTVVLYVQDVVESKDIASATSLVAFFRIIGAVFGISILGAVLNNELSNHMEEIELSIFTPPHRTFSVAKDYLLSLPSGIDINNLPLSVKQAFVRVFIISVQTTFQIGIAMGALGLIASFLMIKRKRPANLVPIN